MIAEKTLHEIVERLVAASNPSRMILFGSYGRGEANEDSDLDIMVIEPHVVNPGKEMIRVRSAVGDLGIGVDLLVYSEEEIERRHDWCTSPVYWALREGKTLYATPQTEESNR
jgi:uncharacterized protein